MVTSMRWVVAVSFVVAAFCTAYPMYVIRPFRAQGAGELALALGVLQLRPWITVACALAAIVAAWRSTGKQRIWRAGGALLICVLAVVSRVNVFERMFHPVEQPSFTSASDMRLDGDEKVVAVRIGDAARAYPVRSISYHHIVNDTVESRAIVATY